MNNFAGLAMAIAMIAAFALIGAGGMLAWKGKDPKRGLLMIVAALVLVGNVLVWTI